MSRRQRLTLLAAVCGLARTFLRTETGSAGMLLLATAAAVAAQARHTGAA